MQDTLYLDIETIPAQRADILADIQQDCEAEMLAALEAIKPPGNYKKQETIDAWLADEAPKLRTAIIESTAAKVDECHRKTGLDGAFGNVCVIGFAFNDDEPVCMASMDERDLLAKFSERMKIHAPKVFDCTVVGHNVTGFDLRFLIQRCIVHGIRPPALISRAAGAKPWEAEKVFDTMVQWAGPGGRVSLDKLCKALGIPSPKGEITGATVWDAVKAGRLQEVADYCAGDVCAVRAIHRRMIFASAPVRAVAHQMQEG